MRTSSFLLITLAAAACTQQNPEPAAKARSCEAREGGTVTADSAWLRAQADQGGMSAAYFTLCNGSMKEAALIGVSTPAAGLAEIHETTRDAAGVVSMAPAGEIVLKPGEVLVLEPGGRHAMLMDLAGPIAAGDRAILSIRLADGSALTVEAVAKSAVDVAAHEGR